MTSAEAALRTVRTNIPARSGMLEAITPDTARRSEAAGAQTHGDDGG